MEKPILCSINSNPNFFPYELYCLNQYIKQNLDFELEIKNFPCFDDFLSYCDFNNHTIIGFSAYSWTVHEIFKCIEHVRDNFNKTKIVIGGPSSKEFINNNRVDHISLGMGEKSLYNLISGKEKNRLLENNISFLDRPFIFYNRKYLEIALEYNYLPYETTHGCIFKCAYCTQSNTKYEEKPLNRVYDEITFLFENNCKHISILDATFNFDKKRFRNILNLLNTDFYSREIGQQFSLLTFFGIV